MLVVLIPGAPGRVSVGSQSCSPKAWSCRFAAGGLGALNTMSVHVAVLIHFLLILTPSPQSHVCLLIYLTGRSEIWP